MRVVEAVLVMEFQFGRVVCGHHVYNSIWTLVTGKVSQVEVENGNADAVAVLKDGNVVGDVP